ncbi:class I SAM-dependent methyltransferase [Pseudothauera rhizosphaerae]|uniref:Class I SAM-dependent methyltransferase n=1 Tax=Pseudothauera rhizosphaerae TaxID=2565932 RepID=A0A4S4AW07_9RHOO|nr:class I SAM-dependent methyltransferase [Pseudothauera rhizosphaerae]
MQADGRDYLRCDGCQLTFLDPSQRLDPAAERAFYDTHCNEPDDPGYRRFLARLADPLMARLAPASEGLDYGCGPGPALAAMLEEGGHRVACYDPYYRPDTGVLTRSYDFVTCTEVAEHFRDPAGEFARLAALLRPGGWLALMTCFQTDDTRFAHWHYRRDPTHVVFYREETFAWLAAQLGWTLEVPAKDVALLRRPAPSAHRPAACQ